MTAALAICNHAHVFNRAGRTDPTRTTALRARFIRDMMGRFRDLMKAVREALVVKDVFGMGTADRPLHIVMRQVTEREFAYPKSADKVKGFMKWLAEQEQEYILSHGKRGLDVVRQGGPAGIEAAWTDVYIRSAYQQGIARARTEMAARGYKKVQPVMQSPGGPAAAFNTPFHADRVGLIYQRTYTDLKGITQAMDRHISRTLAQGMAEGRNPLQIARSITADIKKIGITRARTLARTEVIRAHSEATIQEYKQAEVLGLKLEAEWTTAGDGNVCPKCEEMEGETFTLAEAEGKLPLHPNCRCIFLPVDLTED
jgi:SPP1 gp7 family putative phage head morphogenesis protein